MTARWIAQLLDVYLPGLLSNSSPASPAELAAENTGPSLDQPFTAVCTDSRKIIPGCLFVAIPGDVFDGHNFMEQAVQNGATGVLCLEDRPAPVFRSAHVFRVKDTQEAYRKISKAWRDRFQIPVICVAGSVGKTTTKELLAAILQGKWKQEEILKTQGSQNGYLGIPMTLLELKPSHQVAVIEVGIDEIGAMAKHLEIVRPTHCILTAIGPEHLEKLIDLKTVSREEVLSLQWVMKNGGTAVMNLDDEWVTPTLNEAGTSPTDKTFGVTLGTVAKKAGSFSKIKNKLTAKISDDTSEIQFSGLGIDEANAKLLLPLPGKHNAVNLANAVATALSVGLDFQEIRAGLMRFQAAYGRSEVKSFQDGSPVLCDYYNSNPSSVQAGLDSLELISKKSQPERMRWAVLGDMLELGKDEEKYHRDLADLILRHRVERVYLYGNRMKWLLNELEKRKGAFPKTFKHFGTHPDLADSLKSDLKARPAPVALMIKGSRGMKMEEVWKILAADPELGG
ncbi:MAG: UDP-N-acetylmuramoyl-tripeptide--D-alanyl-D-alanine ligase [Bdellovibrionales bacterium]|nr:UDP-N-acetylmuramoyl-tripeptide--D-alanyl-D-alanine ligase [Bdellovibrionales bacterium]